MRVCVRARCDEQVAEHWMDVCKQLSPAKPRVLQRVSAVEEERTKPGPGP